MLLLRSTLHQFLLALGKFLELADGLVDLLGVLVHFAALQRFVLVLVLVELEFEQVRKIFGVLTAAAAPSAAAPHSDLDFGEERFGSHQVLERLVFERACRVRFLIFQLLGSRTHLFDGLLQVFRQLFELLILTGESAASETLHQSVGLFGELRLASAHGMDVVRPFLGTEFRFVAAEPVCGRDDLFLAFGKSFSRIVLLTAAPSATALLTLVVFLSERPHFDEVDIGLHDVGRLVAVHRLAVVRHEVAGLEIVFFKEESMCRGDFLRALSLVGEQFDFLFGTAVHGEVELELIHAEVIFRAQFGENFFDFRRLGIASRLGELDDRLLIVEGFHRVFLEAEILLPVGVGEFDPERRRSIDGYLAHGHLLAAGLERNRLAVGKHNAAAG